MRYRVISEQYEHEEEIYARRAPDACRIFVDLNFSPEAGSQEFEFIVEEMEAPYDRFKLKFRSTVEFIHKVLEWDDLPHKEEKNK